MSAPRVRKLIFLGFTLPPAQFAQVLEADRNMPVQTHRFGWSIVEALQSAGRQPWLIAAAPASDYPASSRLLFGRCRFTHAGAQGRTVPFVNVIGLKHVTRYLGSRPRRAERRDIEAVLVHGVHSAFLWRAIAIRRRTGVPVVVVLTDLPGPVNDVGGRASRALRNADRKLISAGLRRVDGVVALTRALAEEMAPGSPSLVMEGIRRVADRSPRESDAAAHTPPRQPQTVAYAGGLEAAYGVQDLLDAVTASTGSWVLEVYGRGLLEQAVRDAAERSDRVVYRGLVTEDVLLERYSAADLLVNPRPAHQTFTRFSFPSKLGEYLASGTPALSTRLPGIPEEYEPYVYWCDDGPVALAESIDYVLAQPEAERFERGHTARSFVSARLSPQAQGARIVALLDALGVPAGTTAASRAHARERRRSPWSRRAWRRGGDRDLGDQVGP